MFSYFYHDIDKEEAEYILPKRKEQPLCNTHSAPVTMFSYPYAEFVCSECYEFLGDKKDCYSLTNLKEPMDRLYAGLMQYIEGGRVAKLDR